MRIIAISTLKLFWEENVDAEQHLRSWIQETKIAEWGNPNVLKQQFRNASILNTKRVVFNIRGNHYRLIVDIEYRLKIVFIVWIGAHSDYDKIDAENIDYVKTNKK